MVQYQCVRCSYKSKSKFNFIKHLQRKNACEPLYKDVSPKDLLSNLQLDNKTGIYKCEHCEKEFHSAQLKYQHKKRCSATIPVRCTTAHLLEKIHILDQKIKSLEQTQQQLSVLPGSNSMSVDNSSHSQSDNSSSFNNNIITNNNFYLRDFGQENISYLPNEFLNRCFAQKDLVTLLENIHCDREHPENHNIRIRSQKRSQIEVRENNKWMVKDEDEALSDCIKNGYRVLVRHALNNKDDIIEAELDEDECEYHDIRNWLEDVYASNKEQKPIKRKLLLIFVSNQALLLGKD